MNASRNRRWIVGLLAISASLAGSSAQAVAPSKVSLDAAVINGEVYVKASSLVAQTGGTGSYDAATKKYTYTAPDPVPSVVKKVAPSVVAIIGKPQDESSSNRFSLAHGTGVILKGDGLILTNAHVVSEMDHIVVVTSEGKEYEGTRKYMDSTSDLALVKINAIGLKPATFAASPLKVEVGETVIALGTPVSFSLRNTATVGVISGMNRSVSSYYNLLQTDAAINPGNSGGPLVNLKGEVVGINSMKFVDVDIDSMGFAIPADTVQHIVNQINKYGKVMRADLGVELEESWSAVVGLPTEDPMVVTKVASKEATAAGLKDGDQLYSVNGKQVSTLVELNELLKTFIPGQSVSITLLSDGDLVTRKVVLTTSTAN
ncbi:S1C family serine protease [Cohnella thailandensis]|uniref:Trypsin-like peptidase domain-containing protein n=1 Tax=Cohnella thailandensis TaxID=557557 RepID=A0A841SKT8_9BACL|nr:trypsin-like peptidase domain-containing protein [Cohnella thailandensis]MBB6632514.1 trypsin-like peptidase domain-containing protein [Cohnella thailandensis]MBP1971806.1 serine protease Do [Cohnella thailandensis]